MHTRRDFTAEDLLRFIDAIESGDRSSALVLADALEELGHAQLASALSRYAAGEFRSWRVIRRRLDDVLRGLRENASTIQRIQRLALRVAKTRGAARHRAACELHDAQSASGLPEHDYFQGRVSVYGPKSESVPTGRRGPPAVWTVRSLDVWGNEEDGFEVNDSHRVGTIRIPTREVVHNAWGYCKSFRAGSRTYGGNQPLLRMIFVGTETDADDEDLWRAMKPFFRPRLPRSRISFDSGGMEDYVEVNDARTGKPLYWLESNRSA